MIHYQAITQWLYSPAALMLVVSLSLIPLPVSAASLQPEQSQIRFSGTQMGRSFTGEVSQFDARAQFSADKRLSSFTLSIPATALVSGNQQRDSTLQTADWLDSKQYPTLNFDGETSHWQGNTAILKGSLKIKETRLPLILNVHQTESEGEILLETEGEIDRIQYQLGTGDWLDTKTVGQIIRFNATLRFK